MKKILLITLIIAFVSTASVNELENLSITKAPSYDSVSSFVLTKAKKNHSNLLKAVDAPLVAWGEGISCSLCERNERICLASGQSYSFCLQQLINCFNTCTGSIP